MEKNVYSAAFSFKSHSGTAKPLNTIFPKPTASMESAIHAVDTGVCFPSRRDTEYFIAMLSKAVKGITMAWRCWHNHIYDSKKCGYSRHDGEHKH